MLATFQLSSSPLHPSSRPDAEAHNQAHGQQKGLMNCGSTLLTQNIQGCWQIQRMVQGTLDNAHQSGHGLLAEDAGNMHDNRAQK